MRHTPQFFKLKGQNQVFASISGSELTQYPDIAEPLPIMMNENDDEHTPKYQIIGGFNNNCVEVTLSDELLNSESHHIEWVCLLTFTGFQFKYIVHNSKKKLLFALADEDAYAYCGKDPCEECRFKCKNGFAVYASWGKEGIFGRDISPFTSIFADKKD
ncbi:hypothetical protein FC83_GL000246 [Agrilactobacillus composti DSM 18527 = JCM 14202]|uniref:Uncharacterized protein n=2 Tax=Agrilactobacillus TaxID=2767875 RepID=A0A0R1XRM3_9LACO|nr:hypothetical protein FC83_GL000246 [Agrilactobacillus composti DSM 18527 = JCM 14202]